MHREGENRIVLSKRECGAVALVYIAVDHDSSLDAAFFLQHTNRHSDIVEDTEALAVIRKRVVRSSGKIDSCSINHGRASCRDGCTGRATRAFDELWRPGQADPSLFQVRELSGLELMGVRFLMDQLQLLVGSGLWPANVDRVDEFRNLQAFSQEAILGQGKRWSAGSGNSKRSVAKACNCPFMIRIQSRLLAAIARSIRFVPDQPPNRAVAPHDQRGGRGTQSASRGRARAYGQCDR